MVALTNVAPFRRHTLQEPYHGLASLTPFLPRFGVAAAMLGLLSLGGCQMGGYHDSVPPTTGVQPLKGLAQNVSVRRNAMGMPLIESSTFHDALFTLGYVQAGDRIGQMVGMRLLAQGRLAEMAGPDALEVDRLMRAVNLKQSANQLYADASPRLKRFFDVYARGVNAYLFRYRDKLPARWPRPATVRVLEAGRLGADFLPLQLQPVGEPAGRTRGLGTGAESRQRQAGLAAAELSG